jgi:transcriptional regulator with GAF, ATPase, and Fis domain
MTANRMEHDVLDRSSRRNWILLAAVCVASTLGLGVAVLPVLEQRITTPWPWKHTEAVLLSGFLLTVLGAVVYLTDQQRKAAAVHRELQRQRDRAAERMRRQNQRLEALLKVSHIMASETSLQSVFDAIVATCHEAFECQQVSLMLLDRKAMELEVRAASGHRNLQEVMGTRQKVGAGIAGRVAATGEPLLLGPATIDPGTYEGFKPQDVPLSAAMVVPILVRGELVGVLNVGTKSLNAHYDDEDLQALKVFAENVGTCIRHTEQAEWMRQTIHKLDPSRGAAVR